MLMIMNFKAHARPVISLIFIVQGWLGEACDRFDCATKSCSGHGVCDDVSGMCICDDYYMGCHCDLRCGTQVFNKLSSITLILLITLIITLIRYLRNRQIQKVTSKINPYMFIL